MARRKNQPDVIRTKYDLSERLREIRTELYGERGGSEMARRLGVPVRTWYNYESGVTVPAEVLLRFMELTGVEPSWLLHGNGSKFRANSQGGAEPADPTDAESSVESLLRTALKKLEQRTTTLENRELSGSSPTTIPPTLTPVDGSRRTESAYRSWLDAEREGRVVRVSGDAMVPIVANGARVAFSAEDESDDALDGALVVAWVAGQPQVRWFRRSGGFGLLRVENPDHSPSIQLLDRSAKSRENQVRRVLWISTPH